MKSDHVQDWLNAGGVAGMEPPLGAVRVWQEAFELSFSRLNGEVPRPEAVLDVGGGEGALFGLVRPDVRYVLLDQDAAVIARAKGPAKFVSDATKMPFPDEQFDVVVSISTAQYMDHAALIAECLRVLKPGGILAMHENGSHNPIIKAARFISWLLAFRRPYLKRYNATIKGYLDDPDVPPGAKLEFSATFGILSPASFVLRVAGRVAIAEKLEPFLLKIDAYLLNIPLLRKLGWFRVFHIRKSAAGS